MAGIFIRKPATALAAGAVGSDLVRLALRKIGTSTFATNSDWTPGAGDVKVSKDGGAQANITTLPSYANGSWEFTLSATEMTAKQVRVVAANAAIESDDFTIDLDRSYAQNELRRIHGVAGAVGCVAPTGSNSNDGLSLDTPFLTLHPLRIGQPLAAGANDLILVAQGSIAAATGTPLQFTVGTRLKGAGAEATTIAVSNNGILEIGGLILEDVTFALGATGALQSDRDNPAVLRRVRVSGTSDALFLSPPTGMSLRCEDCDFVSAFDTLVVTSGAVDIDFVRCRFTIIVPSGSANVAHGLVISGAATGRIRLFDCTVNVQNLRTGQSVWGIKNDTACAVEIHRGGVYTSVVPGGGTALDVENTSTGTVLGVGSDIDPAKVSGSGITLILKPAIMGDVAQAALAKYATTDTGQTTAAAGSVAKLAGAAAPPIRELTVQQHSTVSGG